MTELCRTAPEIQAPLAATPRSSAWGGSSHAVQLKASLRGHDYATQVQMLSPDGMTGGAARGDVHTAAAKGISGSGGALPQQEKIQQSFGGYDISNVKAHTDSAAAQGAAAMGANAYTTGNHVVFGKGGGLHTLAHETAHVVQQRAGVSLSGGVGQAGDAYEQHADRVADAVVQGKSAEGLLGEMAGGKEADAGTTTGIQMEQSSEVDGKCEDGVRTQSGGECRTNTEDIRSAIKGAFDSQSGLFSRRNDAIDDWEKASDTETAPTTSDAVFVGVLAVAASAATAGASAAIFASVSAVAAKSAVSAVTDVMKAASKAAMSSALNAPRGLDTRRQFAQVLRETLREEHSQAAEALDDAYIKLRDRGEFDGMQSLLDGLKSARSGAHAAQRGAAVESWLRLLTQSECGREYIVGGKSNDDREATKGAEPWLNDGSTTQSVGGVDLRQLYDSKKLSFLEYQSLEGYLKTFSPTPRSSSTSDGAVPAPRTLRQYLPAKLVSTVERATGMTIEDVQRGMRVETDIEAARSSVLSVAAFGMGDKSFDGWLTIELAGFDPYSPPRVGSVRISGPAGRNVEAQRHFLAGGKLRSFTVAKRIEVAPHATILLSESNMMVMEQTTEDCCLSVMEYGAYMTGTQPGTFLHHKDRATHQTAGMLFIREAVLGKSLNEHGIKQFKG